MIGRVWHGYTTHENAQPYLDLLRSTVLPGIAAKKIPEYRSIQVLRRILGDEVEFITVMWFDSLENVRAFTGDDYEVAHVPPEARRVLKRFDERSQHYELVEEHQY